VECPQISKMGRKTLAAPRVFPRLGNDLPEQRKILLAAATFHPCIIDDLLTSIPI